MKNILSSYLKIRFNLGSCLMAMNLLPFRCLGSQGRNSVVYVDDSYLQEDKY